MAKATPKDDTEPDTVAQLADDATAETEDYPSGTPEFLPVLKLPRMRRADAYEALGQIQAQQRQVKTVSGDPAVDELGKPAESDDVAASEGELDEKVKPVDLDPLSYGAQYRVIAYIEQYLGVVAKDPVAFAAWAADVRDGDLVKAFNVYIRTTQPGEAESSTG